MYPKSSLALSLMLVLLITVGCSDRLPDIGLETPIQDRPSEIAVSDLSTDTATLVRELRQSGHEVTATAANSQEWLFRGVPSAYLIIDGGEVSVWTFPTARQAEAARKNIAPDGTLRTTMGESSMGTRGGMPYPAPAYYFAREKVIALYFALETDRKAGDDKRVVKMLSQVFGDPVAHTD